MKINQKIIPATNKFTRPGTKMVPKYITIHETDNTNRGADDEAHANLQYNGNSRQASWHFTVDEDSIYQSIPTDEVAWHAGDGNGPGNMKSIAIEICVNSDGNFKKAVENAAWLTNKLMKDANIPLDKVVQHNHWSGKNCPRHLRTGDWVIDWNGFLKLVEAKPTFTAVELTQEQIQSLVGNAPYGLIDVPFTGGQRGVHVLALKVALSKLGYGYWFRLYGVNNDFNQETYDCLRNYQYKNNLTLNGIFDKETRQMMIKELEERRIKLQQDKYDLYINGAKKGTYTEKDEDILTQIKSAINNNADVIELRKE